MSSGHIRWRSERSRRPLLPCYTQCNRLLRSLITPQKLTNAIRIAEVTSDSESRANRNVPKVVRARAQQLDRTPAADAVEPGGTLWDCDELTRAGVKWRTVALKPRSYASAVRNRQRRRRP